MSLSSAARPSRADMLRRIRDAAAANVPAVTTQRPYGVRDLEYGLLTTRELLKLYAAAANGE